MKYRFGSLKKKIGVILMILGVTVFSYPKISDIYFSHKASMMKNEFMSKKRDLEYLKKIREEYNKYSNGFDKKGGSIVDPFDIGEYRSKNPVKIEGDIFAYIVINKLGIDHPVYIGANEYNLNRGMAQVEGTSLPIGGIGTRAVIAGHRGTYGHGNMFRYLDKLEKGDIVYIQIPEETLRYRVKNKEIILPSDNDKLLPVDGEDMLTLLTCHPFPTNRQRLIVNCVRI